MDTIADLTMEEISVLTVDELFEILGIVRKDEREEL